MKKQILLASAFVGLLTFSSMSQIIIDTVSVGAGYANQKWYSLQNDEQGTGQAKDNWDIGFEITGFSGAIIANTQKSNFTVYKAPYKISDYGVLDTAGISNWHVLQNSDTTWSVGAFNNGGIFSNSNYLGWGSYNMSTHIVTGDSCYVLKLNTTTYKKLKIDNLTSGIYNFSYADINGANSQTVALNKSTYIGKNFAYYNLSTNTAVDREPAANSWDLTFVKYISFIPTAYGVTGVLQNKGVTVAQADNVTNVSTYNNWTNHQRVTAINTIGYDWKSFDLSANAWKLSADTCYFVKSKQNEIWKLVFTGFSGSTTGNFILSKEKLSAVGIVKQNEEEIAKFYVYPNPSAGNNVTVLLSSEKEGQQLNLSVVDITGKELHKESILTADGIIQYKLDISNLQNGVYFIQVNAGTYTSTQKLIKN